MDDRSRLTPSTADRPVLFSNFFRRFVPAGLPPAEALIAVMLLVWGATDMARILSQIMMIPWRQAVIPPVGSQQFSGEMLLSGLAGAAMIIIGVALLRRLPWARAGTIAVVVVELLLQLAADFRAVQYHPSGDLSRLALPLVMLLGHLLTNFLLYGLIVYLLMGPRTRANGEEARGTVDAILDVLSTPFAWLAGHGVPPAVLLVVVWLFDQGIYYGLLTVQSLLSIPILLRANMLPPFILIYILVSFLAGVVITCFSIILASALLLRRPRALRWTLALLGVLAGFRVLFILNSLITGIFAWGNDPRLLPLNLVTVFTQAITVAFVLMLYAAIAHVLTRQETVRAYEPQEGV